MTRLQILLLGLLLFPTGCIDPFDGSHIQFTLEGFRSPCEMLESYTLAGREKCTKDPLKDRFLFHYEMWATVRSSGAVRIFDFAVQKHLFVQEQLDLEKKGVLLSSGAPFSIGKEMRYLEMTKAEQQATLERMNRVAAVYAIVGFSRRQYEPDNPKKLIPGFYLGNHGQLTRPHNGTYYGQVRASHPFGATTLAGASITVAPDLQDLDSLWITIEDQDPTRPKPQPSDSRIVVKGAATRTVRGVTNVDASSPYDSSVRATFGVLSSLDEEEYF